MSAGRAEIEAFLRAAVGELIGVATTEVAVDTRLSRFGLDSASALIVTDMVGEWLELELDATLLYEHETIAELATYLAGLARPPGEEGRK